MNNLIKKKSTNITKWSIDKNITNGGIIKFIYRKNGRITNVFGNPIYIKPPILKKKPITVSISTIKKKTKKQIPYYLRYPKKTLYFTGPLTTI